MGKELELDRTRRYAVEIYSRARSNHRMDYLLMSRIKEDVARELDINKCVDAIAFLKKADELTKDTRTEILKAIRQLSKVACALYMRGGQLGEPIRTEFVTATPDTKTVPPIPKRWEDPEKYAAFLRHFGIPDAVIEADTFRPNWPGIVEYASAGKELPPGVDPADCTTEYTVVCRFARDRDADSICAEVYGFNPFSEDLEHEHNQTDARCR